MYSYQNLGGNSSVRAYEIYPDAIAVQFRDGSVYTYSYASAGMENVERMKELAHRGIGLCSFIHRNVKYSYVK